MSVNNEHKPMVVLRNEVIYSSKKEAIAAVVESLNNNPDEFEDGESIVIRFYDADNDIVSVNGVINKQDKTFRVSTSIDDSETLKIVESETEPDKDSLWLQESDAENIEDSIEAMRKELRTLQAIVNRHEYAFKNELNAGSVSGSTDSSRETIMASSEYYDYQMIGMEDAEWLISTGVTFYEYETLPQMPDENSPLYIYVKDDEIYYELIYVPAEEEPSTSDFAIPNVKHLCIKSAPTLQDIKDNILNLLENELVWCEDDKGLYIRTKTPAGKAIIVKINGGSSIAGDTDTGSINDNIYVNDEGVLVIESENVEVTEDGILNIQIPTALVSDDGVLTFN